MPRHRSLRGAIGALLTFVIVAGLPPCFALAAELVNAVADVGITVADADRSAEFFSSVLDFEKTGETEVTGPDYEHLEGVFGLRVRVVHMKLGSERIDLLEYLVPRGRPIPPDSHSNDGWFQHVAIVVSDIDAAYRTLRAHHVEHASSGPQTLPAWNPNAAGIKAFYFKDPDGHVLEIIQFPSGKGDARWHGSNGKLFLGIDHTAVVVADTERSLHFYRDALGMKVTGTSENWGTEQEHLNNVFGARLRITSLRAAGGPGVELLEYLAPRDGRPYPADLRANDLAYWRTLLRAPDLPGVDAKMRAAHAVYVSPGIVELADGALGVREGLTVRDPDGHAVEFVHP